MFSGKNSLQKITYFVIGYMVLAFVWWAIQLWQENDRVFAVERQLIESKRLAMSEADYWALEESLNRIEARHDKRRRMVFAEGLFFTLCLMFGLWIVNRAVRREISLTRQRRNFLLSITHELKSPLASMRLVFETLHKRNLERDKVEKLCANGLRDAARLQTLVEDLLLAARLEDAWQPMHEPVDVAAVARDCIAGLKIRFPHANIQFQAPENQPFVQADKAGLTSVLLNLLENAVKYSPEGAPVSLNIEKNNDRLMIRIADQGFGIPDAEKQAVFEKFYRIGNEETRQAPGTGLGLYIVQQVVKAHGGSIQLSDNKPQGTVFTLEI